MSTSRAAPAANSSLAQSPALSGQEGPRWRRRKEDRPDEILAAAMQVFVERGFTATRADDVAARAGVSKGTLYLYFENKEELFKGLVRKCVVKHLDEGFEIAKQFEGSTMELLEHLMFDWLTRMQQDNAGGLCKLVIAEASNFPTLAQFYYQEVVKPGHLLVEGILQRGIDRGEFVQCDVPSTADAIIAPYIMGMIWHHSLGLHSDTKHYEMASLHKAQMRVIRSSLLVEVNALVASALASHAATANSKASS